MRKWKKIPVTLFLASAVCFGLTACEAKKTDDNSSNAAITTTDAAAKDSKATSDSKQPSAQTTPSDSSNQKPSTATTTTTAVTSTAATTTAAASTTPTTTPAAESTAPTTTPAAESESPALETTPAVPTDPSTTRNIVVRTDQSALDANASMTYPVLNVGSEALSAAINNDIIAQNTALLQKYAATYSDVRLNYQTAFLDSHNIVYTSYYMDYTQPGATKSNTFMFTRIYDLNRGGVAVRVTDLAYSARELAEALLTQDLNTYSNTSLDPAIWEAQKSIILSQSEDELTAQLEKADFGYNNPAATIFTRKSADRLMTIYYPVGASLGDYASFTVKVYN